MSKNIARTLLITVAVSVPLSANDASKNTNKPLALECPTIKNADLKILADTGEVQLNGKSFRLVFEQEIINNYNKRLIESQADLATFLNKSNSALTVTRHVNSHHNATINSPLKKHCPYVLERGTDIAVIAIAPAS